MSSINLTKVDDNMNCSSEPSSFYICLKLKHFIVSTVFWSSTVSSFAIGHDGHIISCSCCCFDDMINDNKNW